MTSSTFQSNKTQPRTSSGNYSGSGGVGSGRSQSDYKAISVQLQLQLPIRTELGNMRTYMYKAIYRGSMLPKKSVFNKVQGEMGNGDCQNIIHLGRGCLERGQFVSNNTRLAS